MVNATCEIKLIKFVFMPEINEDVEDDDDADWLHRNEEWPGFRKKHDHVAAAVQGNNFGLEG